MAEYKLAKTLRDTFNAVDPTVALPSGDPRYVDCTAVRGNEDVVSQLFDTITWSQRNTTQLFTGHRGCGKSTELLRLKARLEEAGYAVIYFAADEDLDLNDAQYSDVLVAIARRIHLGLEEMGVKLDEDLLDDVLLWFAETVYQWTDLRETERALSAEFKLGVPATLSPFAQMLAKVTGQLKTGHEAKKHVRRQLDPQISQLIGNINLLLSDAQARIRKRGQQGLVVLIDNLDRISFRVLEGERNTHDALYIEHGEQLCALNCHLVYTVPIAMFYSPRATILCNVFPDNAILPMIKTRAREGGAWLDGLTTLRTILGHRIALSEIFTDDALDTLCQASGGHVRDLMILVRYACRYAQSRYPQPIDRAAAERAEEKLVGEYSRMIPEEHYPLLAAVHRTKEVRNDADHQLMLHNLSVLEYRNGEPPWHDVHPVVLKLPKFVEVFQRERPILS